MKAFDIPIKDAEKKDWKGYSFEKKYDGTRTFWVRDKLISDRNIDVSSKFQHIAELLKGLDVVLDGEIYLNENSTVFDVNRKENWDKVNYVVFDILWFKDMDLRDLPIPKRQVVLKKLVSAINNDHIQFPKKWDNFKEAWDYVIQNNLEGLIAKKINSRYVKTTKLLKSVRSRNWLKIKNRKETLIVFDKFEVSEKNPEYATLISGADRVACYGKVKDTAVEKIKKSGSVAGEVQYLYKTDSGKCFQPILKRLVG